MRTHLEVAEVIDLQAAQAARQADHGTVHDAPGMRVVKQRQAVQALEAAEVSPRRADRLSMHPIHSMSICAVMLACVRR